VLHLNINKGNLTIAQFLINNKEVIHFMQFNIIFVEDIEDKKKGGTSIFGVSNNRRAFSKNDKYTLEDSHYIDNEDSQEV
jgi:4-hydroxy-3-methylbut-2-enyl diphosphate reductase IspH